MTSREKEGHPEFISGSTSSKQKRCETVLPADEQVQHDRENYGIVTLNLFQGLPLQNRKDAEIKLDFKINIRGT